MLQGKDVQHVFLVGVAVIIGTKLFRTSYTIVALANVYSTKSVEV